MTEQEQAVYNLSEALDPSHQGVQWPNPVAWDGRSLKEQAKDLLVIATARLEQTGGKFTKQDKVVLKALEQAEDVFYSCW